MEKTLTKTEKCTIISGGDFHPWNQEEGYVIACDAGYAHAVRNGVSPDIVLGDFDSLSEDIKIPTGAIFHPVRKDDTDTMLAARYALENGYRDITIVCALGGRLDHTYANLQTAAFIVCHGGTCVIMGEGEIITVFGPGERIFPVREGYAFSVFSLTDEASGVTIKGASYEVTDVTLTNAFPLGCSNHWENRPIHVSFREGILVVMESSMRFEKGVHRV